MTYFLLHQLSVLRQATDELLEHLRERATRLRQVSTALSSAESLNNRQQAVLSFLVQNTKVSDIMSSEVVWCFEDASTEEVAAKMADHQVRRIPIVDRQKKLVGVVALADLATSQQDSDTKADAIEGVSEDSGRARS